MNDDTRARIHEAIDRLITATEQLKLDNWGLMDVKLQFTRTDGGADVAPGDFPPDPEQDTIDVVGAEIIEATDGSAHIEEMYHTQEVYVDSVLTSQTEEQLRFDNPL